MQDNDIDIIMIKFFAHTANESEKQELLDWVNQSDSNKRMFRNARSIYTTSKHADAEFNVSKAFANFKNQHRSSRKNILQYILVAASVAVLIGVGIIYWNVNSSTTELTTIAGTKQITTTQLPDGSSITLHNDSKLSYTKEFENRNVELTGEAFFNVVHNPQKPFKIRVKNTEITVLGTSFVVDNQTDSNIVMVRVITGSVKVATNENFKILIADQVCMVDLQSGIITTKNKFDTNDIAWKTNTLVFKDEPLNIVCEKFSKYFNMQFVLQDSSLADLYLKADFHNPSLHSVIELLQLTYPITINKRDSQIIISKKE